MLAGKTAIVTGSTSGIGQGIARALAQDGANLVINGFGDPRQIESDCAELRASCGIETFYHGADLTQADQIEALVAATRERFGGVDILVNNAGVQHVAPIAEFPPEKWDLIIGLNLTAAFHTTRLCVPLMRAAGWGRIINLASAHALVASPFKSAYVAAKHGIAGLTKVVALEVAEENITCNAICPGYVWTPLVEGQVADTAQARGISEDEVKRDVLLAAQPTKQFVTIEQIGEFARFLCSAGGASMTGTITPLDGGWTAQ
ncbi:MAG: 3-hydroxybutyrate dehydrogenase [Gammaproteobacteria bacterium]|nr:3-hydroxybutyrate dehydrogenase [Gammaproteobacteria bacterium]